MLRKKIYALMLVFTFLFSGVSGTAFGSEKSYKNKIYDDMKIFTSDEFRGRLAGTEENDKAAAYIEERFKEMGIEPYENNSYFQEFPVEVINPDKQESIFTVNFKDGTSKTLKYGEDYIVQIWNKDFDMTLPLGFNVDDKDVENKILVVEELRSFFKKKITPKCIISKRKVFWGNASAIDDRYPMLQISESAYNYLKNSNLKNARIKLKCNPEKAIAKNVIGRIKGSNSKNAVVLSAHFDHVGWAGKTIFRGAFDNASGTSVLLNAAELLSKQAKENKFKTDIIICAFNAEELYLVGSEAFVSGIKGKYENIYNINIDCVGKKDGGKLTIRGDKNTSEELIDEFEKCIKKDDVEYEGINSGASDHESFAQRGIPAIWLGQANLFSEADGVHTAGDNIDVINFDALEKVSQMVYDFVAANDDKIFKMKTSINTGENQDRRDVFKKLNEIQAKEKLEYDEYKIIEVDGYVCMITGAYGGLKKLEDVKKYYPDMIVPHINGMKFIRLVVSDEQGICTVYQKGAKFDEEIGKVYKREIEKANIMSVYASYKDEDTYVSISVDKYSNPSGKHYSLEFYNTEEITNGGNKYYILKEKETNDVFGVYRETIVNNKTYHVVVQMGDISRKNTITKEKIIDFINKTSLENIVRCFGI